MKELEIIHQQLFSDISRLIEESRRRVAISVNAEITQLYWDIGKSINDRILQGKRAEYGKEIIKTLSQELTIEYGPGWGEKHLRHCLHFVETFPEREIVYSLCRQLSWSHFRIIMYLDNQLQRSFYTEMARIERWSVRLLQNRVNSMLYERTIVSKQPEETIKQELNQLRNEQSLSPDLIFKDPYVLDFLGLTDIYSEKGLESSIIAELQRFIIELGSDFAFLARQKRITIDNRDYKIDLLFFHRRLKSMIVVELKLGEFEAGYKGQMELYLSWLEKYEMIDGENPPIGLILCTGKNSEHIELLRLHQSNIKVSEYLTILPSKELLLEKFHRAVEIARNNVKNNVL
jgi:predicted nuclease of restriction endonuclease-like (RecB) superfamily